MSRCFLKFWIYSLLTVLIAAAPKTTQAACSAGIPCVNYDRETPANANTSPSYNGKKTGRVKNTASTADYLSSYINNPDSFTNSKSRISSDPQNSTCDGNFMNQIYARAFMEANREMIMAQQIIHRPDSVLEYTCFDYLIGSTALYAGPVFSESDAWKNHEIETYTADTTSSITINTDPINEFDPVNQDSYSVFTDSRLNFALAKVLIPNLKNYIEKQFPDKYQSANLSFNNSLMRGRFDSLVLNDYACTEMYTVWDLSKCADFGEEDKFRSFQHLVDFDPRSTPASCSGAGNRSSFSVGSSTTYGTGNTLDNRAGTSFSIGGLSFDIGTYEVFSSTYDSNGDGAKDSEDSPITDPCPEDNGSGASNFSNALIRVANNCDKENNGDTLEYAYSAVDPMEDYLELVKGAAGLYLPGTGNSTGLLATCGDPIPTGVLVATYKNAYTSSSSGLNEASRSVMFHYDHFCSNPGCVFVPLKSVPLPDSLPVSNIMNLTGSSQSLVDFDISDFQVSYGGECLPLGNIP